MADELERAWSHTVLVSGKECEIFSHQYGSIDESSDNIDIWVAYEGLVYGGIVTTPKWVADYLVTNSMGDMSWYCDHDLILPDLSIKTIIQSITILLIRDELKFAFKVETND